MLETLSLVVFEVRFYYRALQPSNSRSFPWKPLWKSKVPTKIIFFLWTEALDKILTVEILQRRQVVVVVLVDWCCIC